MPEATVNKDRRLIFPQDNVGADEERPSVGSVEGEELSNADCGVRISEWRTPEWGSGRGVGSGSPFDGGVSGRLFRVSCLCRGSGSRSRNGGILLTDLSRRKGNHEIYEIHEIQIHKRERKADRRKKRKDAMNF